MRVLRSRLSPPGMWSLMAAGLVALVSAGVLTLAFERPLQVLDATAEAYAWKSRVDSATPSAAVDRRVILVDINDETLAQTGSWPWPRSQTGVLLEKIAQYKPAVIAVDMAFPDSTRAEEDRAFLESLERINQSSGTPVVLGQILDPRLDGSVRVGHLQGQTTSALCSQTGEGGYLGFFSPSAPANVSFAHLGFNPSEAGWARSVPAWRCYQSTGVYSLAVEALARVAGAQPEVRSDASSISDGLMLEFKDAGIGIPTDGTGSMFVSYAKPRTEFFAVPASMLLDTDASANPQLNEQLSQQLIAPGSIVVLGSTAFGLVDSVATPLDDNVGGFEVQARLLLAAIDGQFPYFAPSGSYWMDVSGFLGTLIMSMVLVVLAGWKLKKAAWVVWTAVPLVIAGAFAGQLVWLALEGPVSGDFLLHPALPVFMATVFLLTFVGAEAIRIGDAYRRAYSVLGTLFSSEDLLGDELAYKHSSSISREAELTLLSVKLRNFSRLAAAHGSNEASRVLEFWYQTVTEEVRQAGGVVLEFQSSTVVCGFPATSTEETTVAQAHQRILSLASRLVDAPWLDASPALKDLCPLAAVEHGRCLVGVLGHERRKATTVVGPAHSMVFELLNLCTDTGSAIVIGPLAAMKMGLEADSREHAILARTDDGVINLASERIRCLGTFLLSGSLKPEPVWSVSAPSNWLERSRRYLLDDEADSA